MMELEEFAPKEVFEFQPNEYVAQILGYTRLLSTVDALGNEDVRAEGMLALSALRKLLFDSAVSR